MDMITYHLDVLNSAVTFQITYQNERLNTLIKKLRGFFTASNGWKVAISNRPEILKDSKTIYLRGKKSQYDNDVVVVDDLGGNKETKKFAEQIHQALKELCAKAYQKEYKPVVLIPSICTSYGLSDIVENYKDSHIVIIKKG